MAAASALLEHMHSERGSVEQRIRQLQEELRLIEGEIGQQEDKAGRGTAHRGICRPLTCPSLWQVRVLDEDREMCAARIDLIGRTLGPLETEVAKISILLQGLTGSEPAMPPSD